MPQFWLCVPASFCSCDGVGSICSPCAGLRRPSSTPSTSAAMASTQAAVAEVSAPTPAISTRISSAARPVHASAAPGPDAAHGRLALAATSAADSGIAPSWRLGPSRVASLSTFLQRFDCVTVIEKSQAFFTCRLFCVDRCAYESYHHAMSGRMVLCGLHIAGIVKKGAAHLVHAVPVLFVCIKVTNFGRWHHDWLCATNTLNQELNRMFL
eukprot:365474-Chlamydomonas_euryale.AAC.10